MKCYIINIYLKVDQFYELTGKIFGESRKDRVAFYQNIPILATN